MACQAQRTMVLASGNSGKLRELRQSLGDLPLNVIGLGELAPLDEPVEDGRTFADNARLKAIYYARATGQWCLADDSGLVVDVLDGAPGVRSARYAQDDCPPGADRAAITAANNARLTRELGRIPAESRTARFVCALALADADGNVLLETADTVEGLITDSPRGNNGFGYDPLFLIPDKGMTVAELTAEEKNAISHRGKAVRRFAEMLGKLLARETWRRPHA